MDPNEWHPEGSKHHRIARLPTARVYETHDGPAIDLRKVDGLQINDAHLLCKWLGKAIEWMEGK